MKYGEIIKKAYNLTLTNKVLWLFGLLIGGGFGVGSGSNFSFSNDSSDQFNEVFSNIWDYWYILLIIGFFLMLLIFVAIVLSVIARGGLYHGISVAASNMKVSFKDSFKFGISKFWRVLGVQLLMVVAVIVILLVIFIPAMLLFIIPIIGWILAAFLIIVEIFALIIFIIMVRVLLNIIYCYIILQDKKIFESIKLAWVSLKKKFGDIIVMSLIIWGISLAIGIVTLLFILILAVIFGAIGLLAYLVIEWIGAIIVGIIAILIIIALAMFIRSILNTYIFSAWYYTWQELVDKK